MPVLPLDDRSVAEAVEALRSGFPIVIPAPSPLAYAITGTEAAAVNTAKNRPASQPVGVSVADIEMVAPYLDLAAGTLRLARWLTPAISGGMLFFTSTPWLGDHGHRQARREITPRGRLPAHLGGRQAAGGDSGQELTE